MVKQGFDPWDVTVFSTTVPWGWLFSQNATLGGDYNHHLAQSTYKRGGWGPKKWGDWLESSEVKHDIRQENTALPTHSSLLLSWTAEAPSNILSWRVRGSVNVYILQWMSNVCSYLFLGLGVPLLLHRSSTQKHNFPLFCSSPKKHYLWKISVAYIEGTVDTSGNRRENTTLFIYFL